MILFLIMGVLDEVAIIKVVPESIVENIKLDNNLRKDSDSREDLAKKSGKKFSCKRYLTKIMGFSITVNGLENG